MQTRLLAVTEILRIRADGCAITVIASRYLCGSNLVGTQRMITNERDEYETNQILASSALVETVIGSFDGRSWDKGMVVIHSSIFHVSLIRVIEGDGREGKNRYVPGYWFKGSSNKQSINYTTRCLSIDNSPLGHPQRQEPWDWWEHQICSR